MTGENLQRGSTELRSQPQCGCGAGIFGVGLTVAANCGRMVARVAVLVRTWFVDDICSAACLVLTYLAQWLCADVVQALHVGMGVGDTWCSLQ